jgi:spore coat polysaccharide biosynthesis protein SpsF
VDQPLVQYCREEGFDVFEGSHLDVLSRYAEAAIAYQADNIIRITADCPLIDPDVVDQVIIKLIADPFLDYACNFFPQRRFPRGLDAEAFTSATLLQANKAAVDLPEREHVTLQIYRNPSMYKIGSVQTKADHSSLRWTVDTADDLTLINSIYQHFGVRRFRWRDVIDAYRENPHWRTINQNIIQKRVA